MYRTIRVPLEKGEEARLEVIIADLFDDTRKIRKLQTEEGTFLEIPVTEAAGEKIGDFPVIEQENPEFLEKTGSLKEYLKDSLTEAELACVPSGWHILGDIIIVSIPESLESKKIRIAEALLSMYPKCRSVVRDFGIEGQFRQPKRELLLGTSTETIHKEHGCLFKQDVTKVMYSKGNLEERKRMSKLGSGEIVVDMFAGIGYFSIPMAVHARPEKIISIEINPESFAYLKENVRLNHVEDIITPVPGDCSHAAPEGEADRVIMGYVGTTHHYLEPAMKALKKSGGILHYHETVPENLARTRPEERIKKAAGCLGKKVEVLAIRRIKKYSPGVLHVVVDVRIFE
ncbi:methyltransferase [Methanosarcina sp. 2.H.T.1A.6]|uniref:class I SAM-dependent methyltransferase n=1 Tax=unclassified Methanosarcina TaxID=2644672 RepID=UPI000621AB49|nr:MULTISPECIES: class I SAM-dependent methyltransferase family protein [unclassified Methanosarcina]KKG16121.1 methyltransferase [Methanosarcina sp. 2.H.T.1A.15]KKG16415.1 methyltransferase [Methanosarcina sp. 2.H.T.1A.3]KKG21510.1 methyltransferase [Methanosarcina sp. 2.H.T.1A.6]KKG27418.1 methyltransferase [Methanosarcina sp. 2.H.T.1A.8]